MATNLLTDRGVLRAKPSAKEVLLRDGNGLNLRIRTTGVKTWLLRYTFNKVVHRVTLGTYPEVTLSRARELVTDTRRDIQEGKDIRSEPDTPETPETPETLDELFKLWFEVYVVANRASEDNNDALKSRYDRYVKPKNGHKKTDTFKRGVVLRILDEVVALGVKRQANLVLSELRQMFTYAAVREWIPGDPTAGIAKKNVGGAEQPAERVLSEDELCHLKVILSQPRPGAKVEKQRTLPLRTELAMWLALSTMARAIEVATVRAEDVDLEKGIWSIPAEIAKNDTAHMVHLNVVSKKVFGILLSMSPEGYLFASRDGRSHIQRSAFTRELTSRQGGEKPRKGRRVTEELCLEGGLWTMHDLRRTGATMLGEMDFDEKLIDLCLNHKEVNKLKKTYQRQQRLPARKVAFQALGLKLSELLGGVDFLPTP